MEYPKAQIRADAGRIQQWLLAGRDVYVYYNNDVVGHAVTNARQLLELVSRPVGDKGRP